MAIDFTKEQNNAIYGKGTILVLPVEEDALDRRK